MAEGDRSRPARPLGSGRRHVQQGMQVMLKLESLCRRFGQNRAVDAVTLDLPAGQMVGLVGAAGSGKSTLLRLIGRLIDPTAGRILHAEVDIAQLQGRALREWRSDCAMVAAPCNLIGHASVMANVLSGLSASLPDWRSKARFFTPRERALATAALARVGMDHAAHQPVAILSEAGRRRVVIARALVQGPKLLLADDPVAGLDATQAADVMAALRAVNAHDGITIICALADPGIAQASCDRIIGMRAGRVVFDDAPHHLGRPHLHDIYGAGGEVMQSAMDLVSAA